LLTATNPESGTISYAYDANSNLITKTAPKPNPGNTGTISITYSYDVLNRLLNKTYGGINTAAAN
jgi:YD repeat-containing protein